NVIKEYRVYAAAEKATTGSDDYLVSHSSYVYLMDPAVRQADRDKLADSGAPLRDTIIIRRPFARVKVSRKPPSSRAKTSPSNTAGGKAILTGCLRWQPSWHADRLP